MLNKKKVASGRTLLEAFADAFVDFTINTRYQKLCPRPVWE